MPEKNALERARRDKREGKAPSTQAERSAAAREAARTRKRREASG